MKTIQVSAKKTDGQTHVVNFELAENLEELVEQFNEESVFKNAVGAIVVSLQSFIRSKTSAKENPLTGKALQTAVDEWKPGVRTRGAGTNKIEKMKERISAMSPEEKAALLDAIQSSGNAPAKSKPAGGKKK